jgi:hypothetical protein
MIEERLYHSQKEREPRLTKRYPITAQVSFQWKGTDQTWYQCAGVTQEISACSVTIIASEVPPLGAEVKVTVMLPPVRPGAIAKGRLSGTGTVVRVTSAAGFIASVPFRISRAA